MQLCTENIPLGMERFRIYSDFVRLTPTSKQLISTVDRIVTDTRDTCAVSRYFVLLRYTAVYRDLDDTGIVA